MTGQEGYSITLSMQGRKYVVTGGAGFIGSNLVRRLLSLGADVWVVDNFDTGKPRNLAEVREAIRVVEGDIRDRDLMRRTCEGAAGLFHLAAIPSVQRSVEDPAGVLSVLVDGTSSVLEAARDAGVGRVVYSASSAAYGNVPKLPKAETDLPQALSPYAVGKVSGEYLCRAFFECYGLETISLRYFNVFGPRQDPKSPYGAVIPKFIHAYLHKEAPVLFGDGLQTRDFVHVDNVVQANILAMNLLRTEGQVVNVACGDRITLLDLLDALAEIFGYRLEPRMEPPRAGDVRHSQADITLARELLGYETIVGLRDGLAATVRWYESEEAAR